MEFGDNKRQFRGCEVIEIHIHIAVISVVEFEMTIIYGFGKTIRNITKSKAFQVKYDEQ